MTVLYQFEYFLLFRGSVCVCNAQTTTKDSILNRGVNNAVFYYIWNNYLHCKENDLEKKRGGWDYIN